MDHQKSLEQMIGIALVALVLIGCSRVPTEPIPTPTPACALECAGSATLGSNGLPQPSLRIKITCESGEFTESMSSWQVFTDDRGIVTKFEGTRIYKNTENEYRIVADASQHFGADNSITIQYYAEVTGDVFGDTPQTCKSD